jgi:hypothetical protein
MSGSGWILIIVFWMATTGIAFWVLSRLFPQAHATRSRGRTKSRLQRNRWPKPPEKSRKSQSIKSKSQGGFSE